MGKRGWGGSPKLPGRWECILDDIVVKLEKQNVHSKQPQWKCSEIICIWLYNEHEYSFNIYYKLQLKMEKMLTKSDEMKRSPFQKKTFFCFVFPHSPLPLPVFFLSLILSATAMKMNY